MSTKCLIVDDELFARELIANHLSKIEGFEVVGECQNALDASKLLRDVNVDLVFLDIQMPEISGLEFIKTLKKPPAIIFTTAYRDFAVDAFEIDAIDYLVKPISLERFLLAVNKYIDRIVNSGQTVIAVGQSQVNFLYFKADRRTIKLSTHEIQYIESLDDYVKIYAENKVWITRENISSLDESLPSPHFIRIHRSFIVNSQYITAYSGNSVFLGKLELPFGRAFKHSALRSLGKEK